MSINVESVWFSVLTRSRIISIVEHINMDGTTVTNIIQVCLKVTLSLISYTWLFFIEEDFGSALF